MARLYIDGILQVGVEVKTPPDSLEAVDMDMKDKVIPLVWDQSVSYRAVIADTTEKGEVRMWSPVIYFTGMHDLGPADVYVSCIRQFNRYSKQIRLAELLLT